ncbi:uncharacterized protein PV09_07684 [Verruconis gallopava]|uniref:C2H2-type domain-containing protein n=1 Tax=Verruconis gallopava TaxID=253628 RepID=A0A0D2A1S5_9PEZI|nr:uncharacterized protein PV09_07684 [Verruconis gallopava]KIW00698.1 hypothetical protein PV09_07684 [Verruconis gallopava]
MHPGPDPMGAPASFAQRRPNAPSLPQFDLPPFPKHPYSVSGSQAGQTPASLASVGNLLTPPSTVAGDGNSPQLTGVPSSSAPPPVASTYAPNTGYAAWSPPNQGNPSYAFNHSNNSTQSYQHPQQRTYSPHQNVVRNSQSQAQESPMPAAHYEVAQSPYQNSGPMSTPATLATMGPPQSHPLPSPQQHSAPMMGSSTPVSSAAGPSPVHTQEPFRPGPSQYYSHQPPNTPHSGYPYSTGPSPTISTPLSAGGPMTSRPQMSPATPGPLSAPPVGAGHYPGRAFSAGYPGAPHHGPVLSNLSNPGGPPMLVGNLPTGMMNFNSGHAASLQHMYNNSPHPPSQPAHNDRPFKCDQCPQSFNRNHDLKRHKRIHLAVKPFPCGHCDKSFSRKDALKRHILVKGCGKAQAEADAKKSETSSDVKNEKHDVKPIQA